MSLNCTLKMINFICYVNLSSINYFFRKQHETQFPFLYYVVSICVEFLNDVQQRKRWVCSRPTFFHWLAKLLWQSSLIYGCQNFLSHSLGVFSPQYWINGSASVHFLLALECPKIWLYTLARSMLFSWNLNFPNSSSKSSSRM